MNSILTQNSIQTLRLSLSRLYECKKHRIKLYRIILRRNYDYIIKIMILFKKSGKNKLFSEIIHSKEIF